MKKIIDDIKMDLRRPDIGYPIMFTNQQIRKMFYFANLSKDDIFIDLGCGFGQNLIIAIEEFHVRQALGIERNKRRQERALKRFNERRITKPHDVICGDLFKIIKNKNSIDVSKATVVFYGLETDSKFLETLKENLSDGCRLIYYFNCLFPEILPTDSDFPFYKSVKPFKTPESSKQWLKKVIKLRPRIQYTEKMLWDELSHDFEIEGIRSSVRTYKKRLEKVLKNI